MTTPSIFGVRQNPQSNGILSPKKSGDGFKKVTNKREQALEFEKKRLLKASYDLEATFVYQMIKEMRKTIHREDNPLYGGHAEDIFQEMLDHKYAELISNSSKLGLAIQIYNQMVRYVK